MSETVGQGPDPDFVALVRSALMHLYDPAYLQNHPLVTRLGLDASLDRMTRAQELRRALLEGIEALRAEPNVSRAEATRAYTILTSRYVDGLTMEDVGAELGLSERSLYRAHKEGLQAVACLLWDRTQNAGKGWLPASAASVDRLEAVQAELNHLQPTVHLQSVELQPTLETILAMLAPITAQTGASITVLWPDAWPTVLADRVVLRQALVTLLSHALCTVRGDLRIAIAPERGGVLIEVRGVPASPGDHFPLPSAPESSMARRRGFPTWPLHYGGQVGNPRRPCATVDDARRRHQQPDRTAPAVARALIEAQGGRLEMLGGAEGWEARILLPGAGGATILVVDDNAGAVALFRRYLSGYKVTVVAADGGEQALRLATELQPQLIALDVMMPNQDGWEILQGLKNTPEVKHIPVVVCSVLNEPALALSMGASGYITKPVERLVLLEMLQRHLGPLPQAPSPQEE